MIQLFKIPGYKVDTSKFKNLLHDDIKWELERKVGEYLGAKNVVAVDSCTSGIFLSLMYLKERYGYNCTLKIPCLITTRFLNVIIHAGFEYEFTDDIGWVGKDYYMDPNLIDSAQRFDPGQFEEYPEGSIAVFSCYPTKPLGGNRGGFVVSNRDISWIKQAAYFGEDFAINSWDGRTKFPGYQMYMDSIQAYFINESLKRYERKREKLDKIRKRYNEYLSAFTDDSYHLYRVMVRDNKKAQRELFEKGIITGIHYPDASKNPVYGKPCVAPRSERQANTALSIPFHEDLKMKEVDYIIKAIDK